MSDNPDTKPDTKPGTKPDTKPDTTTQSFFHELPITIEIENQASLIIFMRPLLIKEIQVLNRVTYLQERDSDSDQAALLLINLMTSTLNIPADELPAEAIEGLIIQMIKFNFPESKNKAKTSDQTKNKQSKSDGLVECFDFLISNGHNYPDILNYPILQFNQFIVTIAERLGIKKKPIPATEGLQKLGIM